MTDTPDCPKCGTPLTPRNQGWYCFVCNPPIQPVEYHGETPCFACGRPIADHTRDEAWQCLQVNSRLQGIRVYGTTKWADMKPSADVGKGDQ